MDLSKFSAELQKAGLTVTEEAFSRFNNPEDFVLPYIADHKMFYEINMRLVKDANYIERTKRPVTEGEIKKCKIIQDVEMSNAIVNWMLKNMDKLQAVNKGSIRKKEDRFAATKDFEEKYEKDTEYGLSVLGCIIKYSKYDMSFHVEVPYHDDVEAELAKYKIGVWDFHRADKVASALDAFAKISEYIPVFFDPENGVTWNYTTDYRASWRSSYGENILNSKFCMDRLKNDGFFKNGARINSNAWYFFVCGNDGNCYLKRDTKLSPKKTE